MLPTKEFVTIASMDTLSERLKHALEATGIKQSELARRIGVKPQAIQAICSGRVLKSGYTTQMANALGINPEWLAKGIGPMRPEDGRRLSEELSEEAIDLAVELSKMPPEKIRAVRVLLELPDSVNRRREHRRIKEVIMEPLEDRRSGDDRRQQSTPPPISIVQT